MVSANSNKAGLEECFSHPAWKLFQRFMEASAPGLPQQDWHRGGLWVLHWRAFRAGWEASKVYSTGERADGV